MKRIAPVACVVWLAAVGCGGGTSTTTPPGNDTTNPPSETDSGQSTDLPTSPMTCSSDADCPDQICDCLGRCVPPGVAGLPTCSEDINCGSGHFCDTCAGVCRAPKLLCEPCANDGECADDGACLDFITGGRFCLKACVADNGCPQPGYQCKAITGTVFSQCVPLSGSCEQPVLCTLDGECPFGEICDQGSCGPGCVDDPSCPDAQVCTAFRCVSACSDSNPCPADQLCDADGHCAIEGGCVEAQDCEEPETYCDLNTNLCVPGCLMDFDCKSSAKECVGGQCVEKGCAANYFCAFEEVCVLETGKCEPAPGPYCEPDCDPQSDTACGGKPNWCISLQDKDGNDQGAFCFVACGPDPANACPQGYSCEQLTDQSGAVQGTVCMRDCTSSPI